MPGMGTPSVPKTLSGGSPMRVVVTSRFSVMPQPDTMWAFKGSVARCTSARGIGAPAEIKMLSVGMSYLSSAEWSVRSARKGVAAIIKCTPSSWMR